MHAVIANNSLHVPIKPTSTPKAPKKNKYTNNIIWIRIVQPQTIHQIRCTKNPQNAWALHMQWGLRLSPGQHTADPTLVGTIQPPHREHASYNLLSPTVSYVTSELSAVQLMRRSSLVYKEPQHQYLLIHSLQYCNFQLQHLRHIITTNFRLVTSTK